MFHLAVQNKLKLDWRDLFFRQEDSFYGGIYSDFTEISMLYARKLPSDYLRHSAYKIIHQGTDIFDNLAPIDENEARKFRNHGKFFTKTVPHIQNCKIRGINPNTLNLQKQSSIAHEQKSGKLNVNIMFDTNTTSNDRRPVHI